MHGRVIFFAITRGPTTDSALPYLNMSEILTVNNLYRLSALKFIHFWHEEQLPHMFDSISNILVMHTITIQDIHQNKTYIKKC